jgi:hypothetical protein
MRERAATIDAALTIESAPGRGTTVTLVVPRADRHEPPAPGGGVPAATAVLPGARDTAAR